MKKRGIWPYKVLDVAQDLQYQTHFESLGLSQGYVTYDEFGSDGRRKLYINNRYNY
jgi:hypothetical protein